MKLKEIEKLWNGGLMVSWIFNSIIRADFSTAWQLNLKQNAGNCFYNSYAKWNDLEKSLNLTKLFVYNMII